MGCGQFLASVAVIGGNMGAGAFVKFHRWRWSYYLNAIFYGTTFVLVTLFYHPPPPGLRRHGARLNELVAKVDYISILVFAASLASIIISVT
jgi:MFS family permease